MAGEKQSPLTADLKGLIATIQSQIGQIEEISRASAQVDLPALQLMAVRLSRNVQQIGRQIIQLEDDHANLVAMAEISQIVNSSLELNAVLEMVMDTIVHLTGAERGFLMLYDDGEGEHHLVPQIARNWEKVSLESSEYEISQTVIQRVLTTGEAILTTNAQEDPRFGGQDSIISYSLRSILCVPLKVKDKITGVIYTDNRIRAGIFTEAKRNLLTVFANQAAVAIENARLFASVQRTLNEVTALKNLMDNLLASITSGVITSDIENHILLCNKAAATILGRPGTSWVGESLDALLPEISPDLPGRVGNVRDCNQTFVGLEYESVLPNRGQVTLSINMTPLRDAADHTQGVAIVLEDLTERKRLEAKQSLFERMVSPAVIGQLDPDEIKLGGSRKQITTLFADVRGFTSFGEKHEPEQLILVLNRYLSVAASAVLEQAGTIDKFLGDAIMAWFNAPVAQPDHTLRAVKAALTMVQAVELLRSDLPGEAHMSFGVGIHYGDAVLGLIGNEMRLDYTAIGDSVTTAKRIQENAVGGQILISQEAYQMVAADVIVRPLEPIQAKGKSLPIPVYEVIGLGC